MLGSSDLTELAVSTPALGQSDFMQAAAALLPLLLIASILERRLLPLPEDLRASRLGSTISLIEAALAWALAIVLLTGEYVALASLARPYVTRGDQHFVGAVAVIAAALLLLPILVVRAWNATPAHWSLSTRAQVVATTVVVGIATAWGIVEAAAP
jgi:hypothetical protein